MRKAYIFFISLICLCVCACNKSVKKYMNTIYWGYMPETTKKIHVDFYDINSSEPETLTKRWYCSSSIITYKQVDTNVFYVYTDVFGNETYKLITTR